MGSYVMTRRDKVAVRLANFILRFASDEYRALITQFYKRGIASYYGNQDV